MRPTRLPQTLTDGSGKVSTIEYDGLHWTARIRYPNAVGGGAIDTDYEYGRDPSGNVVTFRNHAGEI